MIELFDCEMLLRNKNAIVLCANESLLNWYMKEVKESEGRYIDFSEDSKERETNEEV
jgi:hypothetical protein